LKCAAVDLRRRQKSLSRKGKGPANAARCVCLSPGRMKGQPAHAATCSTSYRNDRLTKAGRSAWRPRKSRACSRTGGLPGLLPMQHGAGWCAGWHARLHGRASILCRWISGMRPVEPVPAAARKSRACPCRCDDGRARPAAQGMTAISTLPGISGRRHAEAEGRGAVRLCLWRFAQDGRTARCSPGNGKPRPSGQGVVTMMTGMVCLVGGARTDAWDGHCGFLQSRAFTTGYRLSRASMHSAGHAGFSSAVRNARASCRSPWRIRVSPARSAMVRATRSTR